MFQADWLKKGYLALMCSAAKLWQVGGGGEGGGGSGVMSALNSLLMASLISL